ncbi:hypothetical protein [Methanohalophilus sp. RSK]|uniref:sodium:solute symporter family transporter n=1 Tax=Methanohalophilus sp. RSK TaxID=2485783 RepID=UPI001F3D7AD5|nr:hypothetical protein [Methanohalophilus sp. RSK]
MGNSSEFPGIGYEWVTAFGAAGYAYLSGMEAGWIGLGFGVGTYLNWKLIAKRIRRYTKEAGDALAIPAYFENRFRDESKLLRTISALFILIFSLFSRKMTKNAALGGII